MNELLSQPRVVAIKNLPKPFEETNLIADVLYGYIEITKGNKKEAGEQQLLDSRWMQRLRRIHQLQGAHLVFPTAEHSRFTHLLGAMHLGGVFAQRIDATLREHVSDTPSSALVEETLRVAGNMHDVGMGPFGHFCDQEFLSQWNIDHEDIGRHLVMGELGEIISAIRTSPHGHFEPGEEIDPRWVAWLMAPAPMEGYEPPNWVKACKPILCGPATIDNLDYVPRDAYMCGVPLSGVDVQRIAHYTFMSSEGITVHANALGALQAFLTARLFLYTNIYFQRTVRRIDLSLKEIFAETLNIMMPGNPLENIEEYRRLNDWFILETVEAWRSATPGSKEYKLAQAWHKIITRQFDWHVVYETTLPQSVNINDVKERILNAFPDLSKDDFEVDIARANLAPENPMTEDGLIIIYNPIHDSIEHSGSEELIARLPQHSQMIRVFTKKPELIEPLYQASLRVFGHAKQL